MKKILLFFIIIFSINIFQVNAEFIRYNAKLKEEEYIYKNIELKEKINKLDIYLLENNDNTFQKYDLLSQKIKFEINLKENEKEIFCLYNNCNYPNREERVFLEQYNSDINNLKLLDEKYQEFITEYNIKIEKEELDKLAKIQELEKEVQKKEYYLNYLERAGKFFKEEDYKNSIENYERACGYYETYDCYYGLGLSNFEIAKEYNKNITFYGYKNLYENAIKFANNNILKSIELSKNEEQKEQSNNLLISLNIFLDNNNDDNNNDNEKSELIFKKLENITGKYSEKKKIEFYKNIVSKLDKLPKSKDIEYLNEKIINYLDKQISIIDRTKDFYKNSLQEKTYSCEISATSDILSTIKNENITESELIEKIDKSGFNDTAKYINGIYIWGNPNEGFVGYIDKDNKGNIASQRNLTGYGVYEKPIEKLYNIYGLKTEIINNSNYTTIFGPNQHLNKLLTEFNNGNYVQLWGDVCTTTEYDDGELELNDITQSDVDNGKNAKNNCWSFGQDRKRVWYYEENGKLIKHQGLIGEHNFYLLGYEGELENPINIIIWDISTGKHKYPIKEWMRKWEEMDFRSIIIYK